VVGHFSVAKAHDGVENLRIASFMASSTLAKLSASKILLPGWRDYQLYPAWRKYAFLLATGLPCLLLGVESMRTAIALTMAASARVPDLKRALVFDPTNDQLEHQLGLAYLYSPYDLNAKDALRHLRRAAVLNPERPFYWSDLAQACEWMGDRFCADRAFAEALRLSPTTPYFYWADANHYLRTGRPEIALARFRRLLELSPAYAWTTFDTCFRVLRDPDVIFRTLLPAGGEPALKVGYVVFLTDQGYDDAARRAWARTVAHSPAFPFDVAKPYIEHLISSGRYEDAVSAWQDLERLGVVARREAENLVFNCGFEHAPLNAGFDWRYAPAPYVSADFADAGRYQGARCLRLDFTVASNQEFEPVFEYVPVAPGQQYVLKAHVRSQDITSDSGPRLRVLDPNCQSCLDVSSPTSVGTRPWHPVELTFSTGPRTRLIRLSVWRTRSRVFPARITGRFWLDAVCLKPVLNAAT
jgi:tetratricopeptide (TPR) repeat protein